MTAIYGQLVVGSAGQPPPAAFALVRVLDATGAAHGSGISDQRGNLMLVMPYPALPEPAAAPPGPALGRQDFQITLQVYSNPAELSYLPGCSVPNLETILGQSQASIALSRNTDPNGYHLSTAAELPLTLRFEIAPILRTGSESFLRIQQP
jgi:hypothetical protein